MACCAKCPSLGTRSAAAHTWSGSAACTSQPGAAGPLPFIIWTHSAGALSQQGTLHEKDIAPENALCSRTDGGHWSQEGGHCIREHRTGQIGGLPWEACYEALQLQIGKRIVSEITKCCELSLTVPSTRVCLPCCSAPVRGGTRGTGRCSCPSARVLKRRAWCSGGSGCCCGGTISAAAACAAVGA